MTSVPIEGGTEAFTPPSLANLSNPPVFHVRCGTRRDKDLRTRWLKDRRARYHPKDRLRATIIAGLRAHWDEATAEQYVPIVQSYWDAADQFEQAQKQEGADPEAVFVFDGPVTEDEIVKLIADLRDIDDDFNAMLNDNEAYIPQATVATMVHALTGWDGIDPAARRRAGVLTEDSLDELNRALVAIEQDPANIGVEGLGAPGTAMLELAARCNERFFLTELTRKN